MSIYDYRTTLSIGFHGCDEETRNKLIRNPFDIHFSTEDYDWLGNGFYLWENNFTRALEWAQDKKQRVGNKYKPSVVGVIYILGNCLGLTDSKYTKILSSSYLGFKHYLRSIGASIPKNKDIITDKHHDVILRRKDCAVINYLNNQLENTHNSFDSVRGVFTEGDKVYPGAGIKMKTHSQICIRNVDCIKGFFLPKELSNQFI